MIRTKLMQHQVMLSEFITQRFLTSRKYAGCFAEYGTGKTLVALDVVNTLKLPRVLVVSTKLSVQSTWPSEVRQHTNFQWVTLVGSKRKKARLLRHGMKASVVQSGPYNAARIRPTIFLINYDGIKNIYRDVVKCPWDLIILDESTKIKSPHTKRTLLMWDVGKRIPRRLIMTGFPVTENLSDLYAQIKFLDDTDLLGSSHYAFLNTYFVKMGTRVLPKKTLVKEMLAKIAPFCRHVTNDVLKLPPKRYKKIDIPLTPKQKDLLDTFKDTFRLELGKVNIDTQYIFALITKSLEICDGYVKDKDGNVAVIETGKDEALVETLEEIDARQHKVVIWAAHRFAIRKIHKYLTRLKYGVCVVTGETENPDLMIKRFQHDKRYTILLATQRKAAESVTLTAAKYAIYYSNTWSYDMRANSEARIRRKGSEHHDSILYIDLVSESDVEAKVYECLRNKGNLVTDLKKHFASMGGKRE